VFLLAALAALGMLSTNIILPSFGSIAVSLDVAMADLGLALTLFFLAFAFDQLLVGPLSDHFGRRPLVIGGLMLLAAGSLICMAATSFPVLLAGRVVQALGACAASVVSRAIARDLFDGIKLAGALAFMMVAMAAAPGFSPLLGGLIEQSLGWRWSFLMVAAAALTACRLYMRIVGETHAEEPRAVLPTKRIAGGYLALMSDLSFLSPALCVALATGGLFSQFTASPAILMGEFGFTALQLGLFFAATVFVVFAAGSFAPRLARRLSPASAIRTGLGLIAVGGLLGAASGFATDGAGLMIYVAEVILFLFGMGIATPLGAAQALAPFGGVAGLASALLGFLQMSGASLGSLLVTALPLSPSVSLGVVLCGTGILGLLVSLPLPRGKSPPPG
jgi:DHA1 family bicyclomycin/chloramphenicol resistance-like MFS transporter